MFVETVNPQAIMLGDFFMGESARSLKKRTCKFKSSIDTIESVDMTLLDNSQDFAGIVPIGYRGASI
jgi:hypothetical protein